MSGVGRHRPTAREGYRPSCTTTGRKDGETRAVARLGLDGQGPQAPKNQTKNVSRKPRRARRGERLSAYPREGSKPEGPRPGIPVAGSKGLGTREPSPATLDAP
jgi:hypothetical protein